MKNIAGKIALVTGGASGIGLEIAKAMRKEGARVVICDINAAALDQALDQLAPGQGDAMALPLDVAQPDAWAEVRTRVEQQMGPVSILCNNAGVGPGAFAVQDLAFADWRWTMGVNLDGALHGVQAFVPGMIERGEGHVVNTASVMGLFAKPMHAAYVASKFAVLGLSEVMRMELAPRNVGVSVLCPGLVQTALRANSQRLRPLGEGDTGPSDRPEGLPPQAVGKMVVEAVRDNRLYVLTHPEYKETAARRWERMNAAFLPREGDYLEDPDYLAAESNAMK